MTGNRGAQKVEFIDLSPFSQQAAFLGGGGLHWGFREGVA